jgi:PhzF family phenazine biosynthesis protein
MMKFYIVDAFTDSLFGGNPAGVVLLEKGADFPAERQMMRTAAELRYSETAFVKPLDGGFHTRYFTPTDEVDLCGHATIAAFTVLQREGIIEPGSVVGNKTLAGDLLIRVEKDKIMMDMTTPVSLGAIDTPVDLAELYGVMGLEPETVSARTADGTETTLVPAMISTGLPDIILPVSSPSILPHIKPDYDALAALSERYGVVGVHAFALADSTNQPITAYCRNFAPLYGIPEEAATGTSNGALTYYLYLNNLLADGARSSFIQGREMDRPSRIDSLLQIKDAAVTVQVGGTGVILAKGEIFI